MRTWRLAAHDMTCGGCGAHVLTQDPVQTLKLPGVKRTLVRCVRCADEPFDPTKIVAPAPAAVREVSTERPWQPLRGLALDFKQQMAREPGEEG